MKPVFFAALLAMCCPLITRAQLVLYVATGAGSQSELYTVNPVNAQATLVGSITVGATQIAITALAFHPTTGVLFGVTGNEYSPSRVLVTINPLTAQATLIGTTGLTNASDIGFAADGTLYAWTVRGGPLATINLTTGAMTAIGTAANGAGGNGLTFTPNGNLYVAGPTGPGNLFTVNTTTGVLTSVAVLSNVPVGFGAVNAMASDASGLLFAVSNVNPSLLLTINPTTGLVTTIGTLPFINSDAMAFRFISIPEPSTVALLALGIGVCGWSARRRRQ